MSLEFLNNYNAQIMEDDMNNLREFLENIRKDPRVNDKMIVLTGLPMCGKTRLIEEIHQYMQEVYLQQDEEKEEIEVIKGDCCSLLEFQKSLKRFYFIYSKQLHKIIS